MLTKTLFAAAILFTAGLGQLFGQNIGSNEFFRYDFSRGDDLELKRKAKIANGVLSLDGKGDFACVPNSGDMHFSKKGMTLAATVKLNYSDSKSLDNQMDMFFSKGREFVFGKNRSQLYFNFNNGKNWCASTLTREGCIPESGKWAHVAVVVEYEEDKMQGDSGYRISIYLNGEKEVSQKFLFVEPIQTEDKIELGKGFGGGPWFMNGEFANAVMFKCPLNAAQIARLCSQEPRVKAVRKGFTAVNPELKSQADKIRAQGKLPLQWLADSFLRAAAAGYAQDKLLGMIKLAGETPNDDLETLAEKFNRKADDCRIIVTPELTAAVLTGQGSGAHPLIGILNRHTGKEIFGEKTIFWEIRWVRGKEKGVLPYNSKDVVWKSEISGNTVNIAWTGKNGFSFSATSEIRLAGARMESSFELQNHSDRTFESVKYPLYTFRHLGKGDTLVYPRMSGVLVPNPTEDVFQGGRPSPFPSGSAVMQFGAYYNAARQGIYFGYEDGLARFKILHADGKRNNLIVGWENPMIADKGKNHFKLNGKAALELYQGQWYEAGRIYRKFLEKDAAWWIAELPRKSTPEWFRNNTLWILFYTKDEKEAAVIRDTFSYLRSYFELPFAGHWYQWSDDQKLGWPHYPIKDFTLRINKELQENGIYTFPYIDSRLWKVKDGPDSTDYMYKSHGHEYAAKDSHGEIYKELYGNGIEYAIMCPHVKGWQETMSNLVKRVSDYGFNGIYHDQVGTAAPRACYARSHGHLQNDSSLWLEKGYWPMFECFFSYLHKHHPDCCHTTEENAEPYLKQMDGYLVWRWWDDNQIPLYQSIYSGRAQFVGRTFNSLRSGDKQSFFSKIGQQLVNAEQLGWFTSAEVREADNRRLFVKKAMHLRMALLDWFNCGRMLAPIDFGSTMKMEHSLWGGSIPHKVAMPVIANSAWEDKDGTRMWLFVNTQQKDDSSAVPVIGSEKGFWICREGAPIPVFSSTACPVRLKPLHAEIWVEGNRKKAEVLQKTLRKISAFDKGKNIRQVLKFAQKKITGTPDLLYTAKDCSDNICCNPAANNSHFGWIQDGALISFGIVDFGVAGASKVTVNAAVDPAYAGGTIQLFSTAPGKPEVESAVFPLKNTGGWNVYKDITVKLKEPLIGKHLILFKINGQSACNFRGWKYGIKD